MQLHLPAAHRLARINYPTRTGSFAFAFLVVLAVMAERGYSAGTIALGVLTLLAYPQLAYLHARAALDSKRAELRNMSVDAILMGIWAAQLHFALWPVCGVLLSVNLNDAVCGGVPRLLSGLLYFFVAALIWAVAFGVPFEPATGPLVTGMCFAGIIAYVSALAVFFHAQNVRLLRTQKVLRTSEEQFRFIAEHAGDLVAVLAPDHRFRYASPSHAKYFDAAKFAEGRDWTDLIHPDDRARAVGFLRLLDLSVHGERVQLRVVADQGPLRSIECEGNPVRDDGGKLQMIVLLCREFVAGDDVDAGDIAEPKLDDSSAGMPEPGSRS